MYNYNYLCWQCYLSHEESQDDWLDDWLDEGTPPMTTNLDDHTPISMDSEDSEKCDTTPLKL